MRTRVQVFHRRLLSTVAATVVCACAAAHPENPALDEFPAGVIGSTEVTYYDIHGRTAAELVAEMRKLGPKTTGTTYFGETQSPMHWTWKTRNSGVNCQLSNIQVIVRSEITLPRWTPPPDTVPGLVAQWKEFLAALEAHEIGHKNISGRAAREILSKLQAMSSPCSLVDAETRRLTDGIVSASRSEQAKYDGDTRHGLTQGAVFPPRRAAPAPTRRPPTAF
jgi:predicted secreted Zn-dependent protease